MCLGRMDIMIMVSNVSIVAVVAIFVDDFPCPGIFNEAVIINF